MRFVSRLSLRKKIALSLSAGLLLMLSVFGYLSSEATQQSRDQVLKERQRLAETMAIHADDVLDYAQAEMQHAAEVDAIRGFDKDLDAARIALRTFFWPDGSFATSALVSLEGTALLAEPPDTSFQELDVARRELLNQVLKSGKVAVAQVPALIPGHGAVAGFASPLKNDRGEVLAVLMAELHPSHTGMNLLFVQKLGPKARAELIDGEGNILAISAPEHVSGQTGYRGLLSQAIASREPGIRVYRPNEEGGKTNIVAYAPIEALPWGIMVEQEEDVVLALPQTLERMIIVMGSLSLLVVLVAAWIAMRGLVRPINQLTAEAERIASGELSNPIVSERQDELGRLARTLDWMRVRLKASLEDVRSWNRELERQVEERTSQLNALVHASQALASTLDTNAVFQIILAQAMKMCGPADAGVLFLHDIERKRLVVKASHGFDAEAISRMELRVGEGIGGQVFAIGEPVICNSFGEILRIRRRMSRENRGYFDQATAGWSRVQKALGVPLISEGQVTGSFVLYNVQSPGSFAGSDVDVLKALADQASTTIKNSRLFEEASKVGTLRELDRLKSEFVARASHELRTPLASVKSLAEVLLRQDLIIDDSEKRDYLASIDRACDRLAGIIDNLLTISRFESGGIEMRMAPVSVGEVVDRVVDQFRVRAPQQSFVVDVPSEPVRVMADVDRLEDVLTNLVSNAIKYSPTGGTISVGARIAGARSPFEGAQPALGVDRWVEVWVADQGIGISETEQVKLFQRFFRADNPTTRRASGAGLGLYIVKAYVEAMGGAIWVESKPSCGSTFSIRLAVAMIEAAQEATRVADEPGAPAADGGTRGTSGRRKHKARVLVVDDELDVLRATARNLRASGYEALIATSGEDAIAILARRDVDVAIVDIALPGLSGLDVAEWIRRNPSTANLPIVIATAKAQLEDELSGWRVGCDGYIKKPFSQQVLLQTVKDLLAIPVERRISRATSVVMEIEARMREASRRRA